MERRYSHLTGAKLAAVTLDANGAIIFERDRPPYRTEATPVSNIGATGAGDTYVSALTLALAAGSKFADGGIFSGGGNGYSGVSSWHYSL